ncbi:MAG: hypothetical protein J6K58_14170 [Lachnospiraceae bacterium]|nr:hypothetical protein [Lachnospiraceae bacterium]
MDKEYLSDLLDRDTEKEPIEIYDTWNNTRLVCPSCRNGAIINPFLQYKKFYNFCPFCGQKIKHISNVIKNDFE